MYNFQLVQTQFSKKEFGIFLKNFIKNLLDQIKKNNPEREATFRAGANKFFEFCTKNFDGLEL
jgi:hypothetical protein